MTQLWHVTTSTFEVEETERLQEALTPLLRNLWGRKPFGMAVAVGTIFVTGALLILHWSGHQASSPVAAVAAGAFALLALGIWVFTVTPDWVKETADAYAERLIDSAIRVGSPRG